MRSMWHIVKAKAKKIKEDISNAKRIFNTENNC